MEESWLEKIIKINEDSLRDLCDNKYINIWITGIPEGEGRQKGIENIVEDLIAENFPNPGNIQVQEARVPNKINPKRNTARYIVIKMAKSER